MTGPSRRHGTPVLLAGVAAIALFLALIGRFWHPVYGFTSFFQLDASNDDLKIAAFRELPVYVHRDTGGYDGLYYAQIAQDPTLRDPELPAAMDNFSYRARRILPPALAWFAGGGRPAAVIHAYSLINVAAWLTLALLLWRILPVRDGRGWLAWAGVLFSAGALDSVRLALTDLVALAVLAGALLAAERGWRRTTLGALAAAALARETSILALAASFKRPWLGWKNVARAAVVIAPLAAWLGYVRWRVGPANAGWGNFTWPVAGWVEKWIASVRALASPDHRLLAWTTLLVVVALTVQAVFFLVHRRPHDRWWRLGLAFTALLLCLGTAVWEGFPGAASRVLLPLNLAFNVFVHRLRAPIIWLVAGNLTVFSGLHALRHTPFREEMAAHRAGAAAALAKPGDGWYGREQDKRHTWQWASRRAALEFEFWPKSGLDIDFSFELRALQPCTVVVHQDDRELARCQVGTSLSAHRIESVRLILGRARLTFSTDSPPVRESGDPDARELGFALYDAQIQVKR